MLGAVIEGNIDLSYARVEETLDFTQCTFTGFADFSNAIFNRNAHFSGAFTQGIGFAGARFEAGLIFDEFSTKTIDFSGTSVNHYAINSGLVL